MLLKLLYQLFTYIIIVEQTNTDAKFFNCALIFKTIKFLMCSCVSKRLGKNKTIMRSIRSQIVVTK